MAATPQPATIIPNLDAPTFASRLVSLYPSDWTGDIAKSPGGVLYSLLLGIGSQLSFLNQGVVYAWHTTRISTATDTGLDSVSVDYFGSALPRFPGETDTSFRSRIYAALLPSGATRPALTNILTTITTVPPRIAEPWSPQDTMIWDGFSYWDIDTANVNPARWGSPELRYQGFADVVLPPITADFKKTTPVYCYDAGYSWDTPSSNWFNPQAQWFVSQAQVDAAINATKAQGTIVWRKYTQSPLVSNLVGGTISMGLGGFTATVLVSPFTAPFVALVQPSWNTYAWVEQITATSFVVRFSTPAPTGGTCDWIAGPSSLVGVGFAPIVIGANTVQIGTPTGFSAYTPMACPIGFNTDTWMTSYTSSFANYSFGAMAPPVAQMGFIFFPPASSGSYSPATAATNVTIPITGVLASSYEAILMPSWNTTTAVTSKTSTNLNVQFGNPAPAGATVWWAIKNG